MYMFMYLNNYDLLQNYRANKYLYSYYTRFINVNCCFQYFETAKLIRKRE
jgi:hypothetical protein